MIEKDPSCEDPTDPELLPVADALQRIKQTLPVVGFDETAVLGLLGARGRVLAAPVESGIDVPAFTNSAMDGYAIRSDDIPDASQGTATLEVIGTAWAGRPLEAVVSKGQTARIMTGAKMPEGTDTVVIQEHVEATDDGKSVRIDAEVEAGRNVRQAGEDVKQGQRVFDRGITLGPAELGQLASLGIPEVEVGRKLKVAFFSTGDELRELDVHAGKTLDDGALFDSNRYTLAAMLSNPCIEVIDLGVVRDNPDDTRDAFRKASSSADAIITSGGISAGEADFVTRIFHELGEVAFWKLAMRPGRPLAFGKIGDSVFFGLPGNPVAVMVTFYEFVWPALLAMMGANNTEPTLVSAICQSQLKKSPGRTEYQRGVLSLDANGQTVVHSTGKQGAGRLSSMCAANCMIVLSPGSDSVQPGEQVLVQPFHGLI